MPRCQSRGRGRAANFKGEQVGAGASEGRRVVGSANLHALAGLLVQIPVVFLGLGVYRAWIEITFVGSFVGFPMATLESRDLFDFTAVIEMSAFVLCARRIGPLYRKRWLFIVCGVLMVASTVMLFVSFFDPSLSAPLSVPASVTGGLGLGLIILIWSELYGCLNPIRVTLYYAASLAAGAIIIYVYMGFKLPWLFVLTAILPIVSLVCARKGFQVVPEGERPQSSWVSISVPWMIMLLMAFYAFSYGIIESSAYNGLFGPHSSPGTFVVAVIVIIGVSVHRERFDFNSLCRLALPLTVVALFLISALGFADDQISGYCVAGGYTAFSILIMVLCSNLCYRYGVSAVWLFGMERSLRLVFMFLGRCVYEYGGLIQVGSVQGTTIAIGIAIVAVMMGTFLMLSQKEQGNRWGAAFLESGLEENGMVRKQEIVDRCELLAKQFGLTSRETEVLILLAQHKTVSMIEHELYIANGTAKAHVRHIYQKFGIHSREELFEVLGIDGLQENGATGGAAR